MRAPPSAASPHPQSAPPSSAAPAAARRDERLKGLTPSPSSGPLNSQTESCLTLPHEISVSRGDSASAGGGELGPAALSLLVFPSSLPPAPSASPASSRPLSGDAAASPSVLAAPGASASMRALPSAASPHPQSAPPPSPATCAWPLGGNPPRPGEPSPEVDCLTAACLVDTELGELWDFYDVIGKSVGLSVTGVRWDSARHVELDYDGVGCTKFAFVFFDHPEAVGFPLSGLCNSEAAKRGNGMISRPDRAHYTEGWAKGAVFISNLPEAPLHETLLSMLPCFSPPLSPGDFVVVPSERGEGLATTVLARFSSETAELNRVLVGTGVIGLGIRDRALTFARASVEDCFWSWELAAALGHPRGVGILSPTTPLPVGKELMGQPALLPPTSLLVPSPHMPMPLPFYSVTVPAPVAAVHKGRARRRPGRKERARRCNGAMPASAATPFSHQPSPSTPSAGPVVHSSSPRGAGGPVGPPRFTPAFITPRRGGAVAAASSSPYGDDGGEDGSGADEDDDDGEDAHDAVEDF